MVLYKNNPNQIQGYGKIFSELGITDVTRIDEGDQKTTEETSKRIGEATRSDSKKSLVVCYPHHFITDITDDSTDHIYFDAHSDDYDDKSFHHGSFINFMKGHHYCIGGRDSDFKNRENRKTKLLRFDELETITPQSFRGNIFLSFDTDVFHPDVTICYGNLGWLLQKEECSQNK